MNRALTGKRFNSHEIASSREPALQPGVVNFLATLGAE